MNIQIALVAAILSTLVSADPHEHVVVKGYVRNFVTAETTTEPVRQALSNIVPKDWDVYVDPGMQLSTEVNIEGDVSWLDNLNRIGAAENAQVVVDAREKRITLMSQHDFALIGSK